MVRHKILSIKEKGLPKHLAELGIDYEYVKELFDAEISNASIVKLLKQKYPDRKPVRTVTIAHWRKHL